MVTQTETPGLDLVCVGLFLLVAVAGVGEPFLTAHTTVSLIPTTCPETSTALYSCIPPTAHHGSYPASPARPPPDPTHLGPTPAIRLQRQWPCLLSCSANRNTGWYARLVSHTHATWARRRTPATDPDAACVLPPTAPWCSRASNSDASRTPERCAACSCRNSSTTGHAHHPAGSSRLPRALARTIVRST